MARLQISPEVKNDLLEIKEYIMNDLDNPSAATNTVAKITKSIRTLISFPDKGTPLSSKVDIPNDYRFPTKSPLLRRGLSAVKRIIPKS